jgi:two-component system, NtrC family, response regulator AtoC
MSPRARTAQLDWEDEPARPLGSSDHQEQSGPGEGPERILVVEDDAELRKTLEALLTGYGYEVRTSPEGQHALRLLQRESIDLVLTDLQMPGLGGEALLEQVRDTYRTVPVITMTGFGSVRNAVALTRAGASDYLTKPLEIQPLLESIRNVLASTRSTRKEARTRQRRARHMEAIVGRSRAMLQLQDQIARVAPSPAVVLIQGETGSGKELVARAVHEASGRGPFVAINCGAIPANLLESELFGHAKGAFTGADRDRAGLFEEAHGGTLFLDEIAELPILLQSKLLRVLQFGELRRLGDVKEQKVDVRVIAATHQDLQLAGQEGRFRQDLYYRINVLRLEVPPLREHAGDIPLLAERFLAEVGKREGKPPLRLPPETVKAMMAYPWPGNVRELQNVIERAAILASGPVLGLDDLPPEIRMIAPGKSTTYTLIGQDVTVADLERQHILAVLDQVGGNRTKAAELLGIPRRTLYRRLEEYGILAE